jgi:hypothetical protein
MLNLRLFDRRNGWSVGRVLQLALSAAAWWLGSRMQSPSQAAARAVKVLHKHVCQFCNTQLCLATGSYAEGAHIRPLGKPHNGPDTPDNVLCLCPNCHVRFDAGALALSPAGDVLDCVTGNLLGKLRTSPGHVIDPNHVEYHRVTIAAVTPSSGGLHASYAVGYTHERGSRNIVGGSMHGVDETP